jgi:hypothetical protein
MAPNLAPQTGTPAPADYGDIEQAGATGDQDAHGGHVCLAVSPPGHVEGHVAHFDGVVVPLSAAGDDGRRSVADGGEQFPPARPGERIGRGVTAQFDDLFGQSWFGEYLVGCG